ncbi:MAG TPA: L-threonylcarbamoyladenylate synthase [Blastocatellia bacterium]|nr:L-threonylcarbamoyladenylate synthase [Blastocatellia bacterium]
MATILKVNPDYPERPEIEQAADVIRSGGLVAFPTETVYGLGANAMDQSAIQRLFEVKGRPHDNPLIVHIANLDMLAPIARGLDARVQALTARFWPGPLTLVLERNTAVPSIVSAGLSTIAVRMPNHQVALALISAAETPVAAPSANRSGRPSPTTSQHVESDLGDQVDLILDSGPTRIGIESTVLDMTSARPAILRPGWITRDAVAEIIGPVLEPSPEMLARSPGTRHRHYTPRAPVLLVEKRWRGSLRNLCLENLKKGRVAYVGHTRLGITDPQLSAITLDDSADSYGRRIYAALREMDEKAPAVMIVEGIEESGEGEAVMERLRRAASEVIE